MKNLLSHALSVGDDCCIALALNLTRGTITRNSRYSRLRNDNNKNFIYNWIEEGQFALKGPS